MKSRVLVLLMSVFLITPVFLGNAFGGVSQNKDVNPLSAIFKEEDPKGQITGRFGSGGQCAGDAAAKKVAVALEEKNADNEKKLKALSVQ